MEDMTTLAGLLRERRRLIADHAWRDRDPAGHLAALGGISEAISAATARLTPAATPRLRHFLENCSFDKALALLDEMGVSPAMPPR